MARYRPSTKRPSRVIHYSIAITLFAIILTGLSKCSLQFHPKLVAEDSLPIPPKNVSHPLLEASSTSQPSEESETVVAPTLESLTVDDGNLIPEVSLSPDRPDWQHIDIHAGDTLGHLLIRSGIKMRDIHAVIHASPETQKYLDHLLPGHTLSIKRLKDGEFAALKYHFDGAKYLHVYRDNTQQWQSSIQQQPIEIRRRVRTLKLSPSLFIAGKQAGLSDRLIMNLANLFMWDIDFSRESYPDDLIQVLYEVQEVDGDCIDEGNILAAHYQGKSTDLFILRFVDKSGHVRYLDSHGDSLQKSFLRTPVKFTRISSKFDLNRRHPVLHHIRAHKGVDYAAPHGTPVKASGDGTIVFAGDNGGYGNVVKIKHGDRYTTVYAHLSRFAKQTKKGVRVQQGDIIGYVGSTGLATGPHLHYEFKIDGKHHDPLTVPLPHAYRIDADEQSIFESQLLSYQEAMKS